MSWTNRDQISELVDKIRFGIKEISEATYEVDRLTKIIGTVRDSHENRTKIFQLIDSTPKTAKETTNHLKKLEKLSVDINDFSAVKEKRLLSMKLLNSFKDEFNSFNTVSKNATQVLKNAKSLQIFSNSNNSQNSQNFGRLGGMNRMGGNSTDFDDPVSIEPSIEEIQLRKQRLASMKEDTLLQDRIIEEEHQQIVTLGKNITELHTIFNDLATIVEEGDQVIDDIESHISKTVEHTSSGVEQLSVAHEYQKSSRSKTCFLVVLILIIILVALGVTWFILK